MRVLWDFRLFSYGYRDRGVGVFVRGMARAIMDARGGDRLDIYIWANQAAVPAELAGYAAKWIPYKKGSWVSDLFTIPYLIIRHRIHLFHYWIGMGPLFWMGMGLFHRCSTIVMVHDCAVEFLRGNGFLEHVRNSAYWTTQKVLLGAATAIVCNSEKTKQEVLVLSPGHADRCRVIYLPVSKAGPHNPRVMKLFVTLGGAPHKNVHGVVQGFAAFTKSHPGYRCVVVGDVDSREPTCPRCDFVSFEKMERYSYFLDNAAGLVVCSTYEGLGIPLLEAMSHGCPVIASDMPVFHETCGNDAARFVDPSDASAIAKGMVDVAEHQEEWVRRSEQGFARYRKVSESAGAQWVELYNSLGVTRREIARRAGRAQNEAI